MSVKWERVRYPWPWLCQPERIAIFNEIVKSLNLDQMAWDCYMIKDFGKFLNGSQYYNAGRGFDSVPRSDHAVILRKKRTRHIIYINQPYGFDLEQLEEWCNVRELNYLICDKSWSFYYPGETEIIMIMSSDTYVHYVENMPDFPMKFENERIPTCQKKLKN